jgi:hypothetical protein
MNFMSDAFFPQLEVFEQNGVIATEILTLPNFLKNFYCTVLCGTQVS